MKEYFEEMELELIAFGTNDVITTSSNPLGGFESGGSPEDE